MLWVFVGARPEQLAATDPRKLEEEEGVGRTPQKKLLFVHY